MSAKRKSFTSLAKPAVRPSPKAATKSRIDELRAAVTAGITSESPSKRAPEEIASDSQDQSGDEEEDSEEEVENAPAKQRRAGREALKPKAGEDVNTDTEMTSPKPDEDQEQHESNSEDASPTFGDLVRGTTSTTVDVSTTLAAQSSTAAPPTATQPRSLVPISSTSLGTVLNQALKTNDRDLLESCLQVHDVKIVQNTINRMDSALACALLTKLADRMHRRPGRALSLMRWMQWTLIAHGGTLVTQPRLVDKLDNLRRVLEERGRGLPKLLALKGKLEMLDQQMQLRRAIRNAKEGSEGDESENPDEPGVVYVEGEGEELQRLSGEIKALTNGSRARDTNEDDFGGTNGLNDESDDESDEEDVEDEDVADEFTDAESLDEDSVDHDDVEEESGDEDIDEDQDDEESAPPTKMQKLSSSKLGKRK